MGFLDVPYTLVWRFVNESTRLPLVLAHALPYYELLDATGTMNMKIGVSGMKDPTDAEKWIVVDTYEFYQAHAVFQFDCFKAIQNGYAPIRCRNCRRFFHAADSYMTFYCNEFSPDDPKRTCRQVGAKKKHKERAKQDPIKGTYNKARNRYYQFYLRGGISKDEYDRIKSYLEKMRDLALRGKKDADGNPITYQTLETLFERKTLFTHLQIGDDHGYKPNHS